MSSRHHPDNPASAPADIEARARITATIISGLRARLRDEKILRHNMVLHELHLLLEQMNSRLGLPEPGRGRHRADDTADDASGDDSLKPDPRSVTTPAEFLNALWQFRAWSGDPSWRRMAKQSRYRVAHSTMHQAMKDGALPKLEVVEAIILGCEGTDEDLRAFLAARRRISSGRSSRPGPATPSPLRR